ncbi:helix-turn-helix domain-containing protein [Capilliphycus salinus ALCB114379]|uniref:helix-turn-helix domain-containing protein n=1 Tax=Capilliphycus salinus TaxID=2768948 RepID=UPI0039A4003F
MVLGTTEAAQILEISTARLRVLLSEGRVRGAYKSGKMWLIPLFNGKPFIERGTRGPAPRWCNPRLPATTIIHVNSHRIRQNQKHQEQLPVITVKKGKTNTYGDTIEIPGGCRVVYRPDKPLGCGARVWIETLNKVMIVG